LNSDSPEIVLAKARLRADLLGRRGGGNIPALISGMRAAVTLPFGATIATLWPLGDEPDLRPLSLQLFEAGFRVALPETPPRGQALRFRVWSPDAPMVTGRFGTMHPQTEAIDPALIFVPLLAFDRRGFRIGYGGGYYDRTLAERPDAQAIGFAFAHQEVTEVPVGPYDVPLHQIVTDTGPIICGG